MIGWKCPGCGACYAPFVEACGNCKPKAVQQSHTSPVLRPATDNARSIPPHHHEYVGGNCIHCGLPYGRHGCINVTTDQGAV